MKDKHFLQWLYNRLKKVYKEHYKNDDMNKLRCIIAAMPEDQETPNTHMPDWEEMRKRVDEIDKGGVVDIPEGLSREELRLFLNGNFDSELKE